MSLQIHQCLPVLAVVFLRLRQRCSGVWVPCSVMFCLPPPATRAAHCSGGLCYGGDDHMAALMCALCSVWSPQWGVGGTRRATDHDTLWRRRQKSPGRAAWWHGAPAHPNGSRGAPGCSSRVSRPILSVTRCARRVRLRVHARAARLAKPATAAAASQPRPCSAGARAKLAYYSGSICSMWPL